MNSVVLNTAASGNSNRISGSSKAIRKQKNRKKKSRIRRRKMRQRKFASIGNSSASDGLIQTKLPTCSELRRESTKFRKKRLSKLKKNLRRSEIARNRDQQIRNRILHVNEDESIAENDFKATDENDCILVEEISDVILIDDDDEKDHPSETIELKPQSSNRFRLNNWWTSPLTGPASHDRLLDESLSKFTMETAPVSPVIHENSAEIRRITDLVQNLNKTASKYFDEDSGLIARERNGSDEKSVLLLENETSEDETSESERSENNSEALSSDRKNGIEGHEKQLFFEDNMGNIHVNQNEIPIYTPLVSRETHADEVIYVSSTPLGKKRKKKRNKRIRDDSVIFISEEPAQPSINLDFLSLDTNSVDSNEKFQPSRKKKKRTEEGLVTPTQKRAVGNAELFTASERKKIAVYNSNTYNPNPQSPPRGKRMVIIDGSNVAYGHACGNQFSVKGIQIAIEYFEKFGHEVKAVVPQKRRQKTFSSDPELLTKLHKEGKVVFTPCKHLPGNSSSSYDDRFILQLAVEFDAAIVSNDNYRDLIHENSAFKKIIESRVIGYTWCNDLFMLPKDPYGRNGPPLSIILNRL